MHTMSGRNKPTSVPRRNFIRENVMRMKHKQSAHNPEIAKLFDIVTPKIKGCEQPTACFLKELQHFAIPFEVKHLVNHSTQTETSEEMISATGIVKYATIHFVRPHRREEKLDSICEEIDTGGAGESELEYVLLPEQERRETLRILRENYAEKTKEMKIMPLRTTCVKTEKRRSTLKQQLGQINDGIKVFQQKKVFVKIMKDGT